MRGKLELILALLVAAVLLGAAKLLPALVERRPVHVSGSDTIRPVALAWSEAFVKRSFGVTVTVTSGGSGAGIAELTTGQCDIAASSRPMKKAEQDAVVAARQAAPRAIVIAIDAVVIAVHPSNPLAELTIQQLSDIYTGKKKSWKAFGGADRPIALFARDSLSGTHVFMLEHVLRQGDDKSTDTYSPGTHFLGSSEEIVEKVAANPDAIGYFGLGYLGPRSKALRIADRGDMEAVEPNAANAVAGRYPVSRPLYFYTAGDPKAEVHDFIEFCVSAAGQAIVKKQEFVPLPTPGVMSATVGK